MSRPQYHNTNAAQFAPSSSSPSSSFISSSSEDEQFISTVSKIISNQANDQQLLNGNHSKGNNKQNLKKIRTQNQRDKQQQQQQQQQNNNNNNNQNNSLENDIKYHQLVVPPPSPSKQHVINSNSIGNSTSSSSGGSSQSSTFTPSNITNQIQNNLSHLNQNIQQFQSELTKKIQEKILRRKKRQSVKDQPPPTESFSIDLGMMWLLKSIERTAIQEHVCERILKLPHTDFQLFLPQIVHVCIVYNPEPIVTMLLEKCKQSLVVAVQTFFLVQSVVNDNNPNTYENAKLLWKRCELSSIGLSDLALLYKKNKKMEISISDGSLMIDDYFQTGRRSSLPDINSQQQQQQQMQDNQIEAKKDLKDISIDEEEEEDRELENEVSQVVDQMPLLSDNVNNNNNNNTNNQNNIKTDDINLSLESLSSQPKQQQKTLHQSLGMKKQSTTTITTTTTGNNTNLYQKQEQLVHQNEKRLSQSTSALPDKVNNLSLASTSVNPYLYCYDLLDMSKEQLFDYNSFYSEIHFINILSKIGTFLLSIPDIIGKAKQKEIRNATLRAVLKQLNDRLFIRSNIILPVYPSFQVLSIVHDEAICLNSRERVPFMLYLEVRVMNDNIQYYFNDNDEERGQRLQTIPEVHIDDKDLSWIHIEQDENEKKANHPINIVFGERWKEKENRVWKTTPFRTISGWRLISFIVKSGDDLRQEQLAMQLITQFYRIFRKTNLPIWLRPYLVIATGHDSGLIETIPDSTSLDTLKKKCPNYTTLLDYFIRSYGDSRSKRFVRAQTNFIESLAGYALVCYFLQIKDRHNGNILLDRKGHLIHIDYGFLLTTSPGNINFESAPFKLTQEYIDLMGGKTSEKFSYFKTLLLGGFLQVRKHYQEFLMMLELMSPYTSLKCICKEGTIDNLKERFRLDLKTDEQCQAFIEQLVSQSINWSTSAYDTYQYYTNGITT